MSMELIERPSSSTSKKKRNPEQAWQNSRLWRQVFILPCSEDWADETLLAKVRAHNAAVNAAMDEHRDAINSVIEETQAPRDPTTWQPKSLTNARNQIMKAIFDFHYLELELCSKTLHLAKEVQGAALKRSEELFQEALQIVASDWQKLAEIKQLNESHRAILEAEVKRGPKYRAVMARSESGKSNWRSCSEALTKAERYSTLVLEQLARIREEVIPAGY